MATTPDGPPADAREADDDVLRVRLGDLEEVPVVDDGAHDVLHVVGLAGVERDHRVELGHLARGRIVGRLEGRVLLVVRREEREELARLGEAGLVVGRREVADAALGRVRRRAAEVFLRHLLVGHGLDDVRAGDEHVARALDHQDEVGDGGRVHGAAGARPQDAADLRDDAARQGVPEEDVGVAGERLDALLDARAARVVEADDRRADLDREIHHLADLLGVGAAQAPAEDGEVLREDEHLAPVDQAVAGDHAVAEDLLLLHAEVGAPVHHEPPDLDEAARIDEQIDALARRQLSAFVLLLDALGAAAEERACVDVVETLDVRRESACGLRRGRHGYRPISRNCRNCAATGAPGMQPAGAAARAGEGAGRRPPERLGPGRRTRYPGETRAGVFRARVSTRMQPSFGTASTYPQPGDVLEGKYRVERLLGEGGMGAVAKATHLLRRAPVALKFMSGAVLSLQGAVERFVNEGVAASQIDSDHVVKVFDVGRLPSGAPYLVMEYLEGWDLGQLLERGGADSPRRPRGALHRPDPARPAARRTRRASSTAT